MWIFGGVMLAISFEGFLLWCFAGSIVAKWVMIGAFLVAFVAILHDS